MWTLEKYNEKESIILSVKESDEVTIEYENELIFDTSFSDGQYKKTADNKKLMSRIKNFNFTNIEKGIQESVSWFQKNYNNCRK